MAPVIDVHSHDNEPIDWLEATAPALAAEIAPPNPFMEFIGSGSAGLTPMLREEWTYRKLLNEEAAVV